MTFDLNSVIKTLLFSTSSALSVKDIQGVFTRFHQQNNGAEAEEEVEDADPEEGGSGLRPEEVPSLVTGTRIREAVEAINRDLEERGEVYQILEGHDGYRFVTRPDHAIWVRLLREDPKRVRLSQAALETLAIVAYRQPVTRAEMESIRGVSVDGALNRLIERELVVVVGRADLPGRPIQYGTSEKFLEFVGVRSLEELPASDVLSQRQVDEWLQEAAARREPGDRDVGLPEEDDASAGTPGPEPAGAGETTGEEAGSEAPAGGEGPGETAASESPAPEGNGAGEEPRDKPSES